MKHNVLIIFIFLLSLTTGFAQDVAVSYQFLSDEGQKHRMQLFLQSLDENPVDIHAVNFSISFPEGCVKILGQQGIFVDSWTDYLEEERLIEDLALTYGNWHHGFRWQYGVADPGLSETVGIIAPARHEEPLFIMEVLLEGTCPEQLYLEHQTENVMNQIGDSDMKPLDWIVVHPRKELSLSDELKVSIFPNPTSGPIGLEFIGFKDSDFEIKLYDMHGKLIEHKRLKESETYISFDLSNHADGMYFLDIRNPENGWLVQSEKIVKL